MKLQHLEIADFTPQIISREMREWEMAIGDYKKFLRLTPENRGLFFALLGKENDLDSYATSPAYYALTGRKGLWVYQDGNSYVPLCWHPNVDGQILVFPPRGSENPYILQKLLTEIPVPPNGIRLARIKKAHSNPRWLANIDDTPGRSILPVPVEETVLDWRYPVQILSTECAMKMRGTHYMRIRNYVNQAKHNDILIERLSLDRISQIMGFAYRWASRRTSDIGQLVELMAPYRAVMGLLDDENFNLDGLVFYIDGHVQAVTVWEPPNTKTRIANAWVNLSNTAYKGLSEFAMKTVAETLFAQGIPYINFGGSETKGLDNYKKKYMPVWSIGLRSVEVLIEGTDFVLEKLIRLNEARRAA